MSSKKSAFTLAEILITFAIIGVIVIFELIVLQGRINQYGAPYYTAYNALKKASYNILADMHCPDDRLPVEQQKCPDGPRPFPLDSVSMCERMKEFINTPKTDNVKDAPKCSALDINDKADNISDKTLRFIASNSFKFYLSGLKTYKFTTGEELKYFIVYVDLNGKEKPNRIDKDVDSDILPDIVPFAVTTRGEVIPMGYPIYSTTYLTTSIQYPSTLQDETNILVDGGLSKTYSFEDAKKAAWGDTVSQDIPFTVPFNDTIPEDSLMKAFYINVLQPSEMTLQEGCKEDTYNCRVVIDRYKDNRI